MVEALEVWNVLFSLQTAGIPPLVPEHELHPFLVSRDSIVKTGVQISFERLDKLLVFTENINAVVNQANYACANTDKNKQHWSEWQSEVHIWSMTNLRMEIRSKHNGQVVSLSMRWFPKMFPLFPVWESCGCWAELNTHKRVWCTRHVV